MGVRILSTADDLEKHYPAIADLFRRAYRRDLCQKLWRQYYVENPYGPAVVAAFFEREELVGHYGLAPQILIEGDGRAVSYYLAITLMIAPEWRNTQIFVVLVRRLLEAARAGEGRFVLAFLNESSFLPLSKLFGWRCLVETSFYRIDVDETAGARVAITDLDRLETDGGLSVPYSDVYWRWRSRRNTYYPCAVGEDLELVYKALDPQTLDIMDLTVRNPRRAMKDLQRFAARTGFARIVLTGYHAQRLGAELTALERWDEYVVRMCVCPLLEPNTPDIRFNLMLCDVY